MVRACESCPKVVRQNGDDGGGGAGAWWARGCLNKYSLHRVIIKGAIINPPLE
jgi:hypothetical protein